MACAKNVCPVKIKSIVDGVVPGSQAYYDKEFQKALALVKTMTAKGGNPVPADEEGLEKLVEFAQERGRNEILNYAKKLGFLK